MMNKRFVPLIAAAFSLLMAVVLVVGAAAAPDPFRGKWYSTDLADGSSQSLVIGGGPGGSYHVRYFDAGATVCGAAVDGVWPFAASAQGFLSASGPTLSGTLSVICMKSPPEVFGDHLFSYTYNADGTLSDSDGATWSH